MKKIISYLTLPLLLGILNIANADDFSSLCSSKNGTTLSGLEVVKAWEFSDSTGFEYVNASSSAVNKLQYNILMRHSLNSHNVNDQDFLNNSFNTLRDVLKNHHLVDICVDSSGSFFGLQESGEDEVTQ